MAETNIKTWGLVDGNKKLKNLIIADKAFCDSKLSGLWAYIVDMTDKTGNIGDSYSTTTKEFSRA